MYLEAILKSFEWIFDLKASEMVKGDRPTWA